MKNISFFLIGIYILCSFSIVTAKTDSEFSGELDCNLSIPDKTCLESNAVFIDCPSVLDYDALIALYNATNGDNWTDNTNWDQNCDLSTWEGITTNSTGRVTRISLRNNGLTGTIPSSLSDLTALTHLYLDRNSLSGVIPPEIGALSNLKYLYLYNNDLSSTIPVEIGDLSKLINCYLHGNDLSGTIPSQLGQLSALKRLYLQSNDLTGAIPTSLGDLSILQYLYLHSNDLSGAIPASLGNLSNLKYLYLQNNELFGVLPESFSNLTSATRLYLYNNDLEGCIPSTWDVHCGITVNLSGNSCLSHEADFMNFCADTSCSIPIGCSCAPSEDYYTLLDLYNSTGGANWTNNTNWDQNCDISTWYGVTTNSTGHVTQISLRNNGLSGTIPISINALTSLTHLYLDRNSITGNIPSEIGGLASLKYLYLYNNGLSGNLPSEIGNLSNLINCYLQSNNLTGNIPTELGQLTALKRLYLQSNDFTGNIPTTIGNLNGLQYLFLHSNDLSGAVPSTLGNLSNLKYLYLQNNELFGGLPASFSNLTSATRLYLYNNDLEGCIPSTWDVHCGITVNLSGNSCLSHEADFAKFCGDTSCSIPTGCSCAPSEDYYTLLDLYNSTDGANWTNNTNWDQNCDISTWHGITTNSAGRVTRISLRDNGLTGSISSSLSDLTALTHLYLDRNALDSIIPPVLGQLSNLKYLYLYNNDLSGDIPAEIGNLSKLINCYLHGNDLSGIIPVEFGQLSALRRLYLQSNDLTGTIPTSIGDLGALQYLYLQSNDLTGEIPASLGNLSNLKYLYLQNNELFGVLPAGFSNLSSANRIWLYNNKLEGCIPTSWNVHCGIDVRLQNNACLSHSEGDFAEFCLDNTCQLEAACLDVDYRSINALSNLDTVEQGNIVDIAGHIINVGTDQAQGVGNSEVGYYLSVDSTLEIGSDTLLGVSSSIPNLGSGGSRNHFKSVNLNSSIAPGQYYIIVVADNSNIIVEQNEANNTSFVSIVVTEPAPVFPDYIISAITPALDTVTAGEDMEISGLIMNTGDINPNIIIPSTIGFYLSLDETYSASDLLLGTTSKGNIGAGSSSNYFLNASIPDSVTAGQYYIVVVADIEDVIDEGVVGETNNETAVPITILQYIPEYPDYVMTQTSVTPGIIVAGSSVDITGFIKNQGTVTPDVTNPPSTIGYYLSSDSIITPEDFLLGTQTKFNVFAGSSLNHFYSATIPVNAPQGLMYILVAADITNVITEADESNNIETFAITIMAPPSCSDGIQNGNETGIDCGGSCDPCIEICDNNIDDDSDGLIDCLDNDCVLDAACPSCSDGIQNQDETGVDCGGGCNACKPDYIVHSVSYIPDTIQRGNSWFARTTLFNRGGEEESTAQIIRTYFYISMDSILDGSDRIIDTHNSSPFGALGYRYSDNDLVIPHDVEIGDYYLIIKVDANDNIDEGSLENELNNYFSASITIEENDIPYQEPDYVVNNVALSPLLVSAGSGLTGTFRINNQSPTGSVRGDVVSSAPIYLSIDSLFNIYEDQRLFTKNHGGLMANVGRIILVYQNELVIPVNTTPGEYFLIIRADGNNRVGEGNREDNNNSIIPITVTYPAHCSDSIQNGTETGIDCGGSCEPCVEICDNNIDDDGDGLVDCLDNDCILDAACPSCSDGIMNQGEVAIDCGGPNCAQCISIDFIANSLSLNRSTVYGGQEFIAYPNYTIANEGATGTPVASYISTDTILDAGDALLRTGSFAISSIGTRTLTMRNNFIPLDQGIGDYFIIIKFDHNDNYSEANEINNTVYQPITVLLPTCSDGVINQEETGVDCGGPNCDPCTPIDFIANSLSLNRSTIYGGQEFIAYPNYTIANEETTGTPVASYISTDTILDAGDALLRTGSFAFSNIGTRTLTMRNNFIPLDQDTGDYFIIIEFDHNDNYSEANEINNTVYQPITVLLPTCSDGVINQEETGVDCGGPNCDPCTPIDFIANSLSLNRSTIYGGQEFIAYPNYTIANEETTGTPVASYISTDTILDAEDVLLRTGSFAVSNIGTRTLTMRNNFIPLEQDTGNYFIIIRFDHNDSYSEASEINNTVFSEIRVIAYPDLKVNDVIGVSDTLTLGEIISYTATIDNEVSEGAVGSDFSLGVYYSSNATYDSGVDILLDERIITSFSGSTTLNSSFSFDPGVNEVGSYFLIFFVDHEQVIPEGPNEQNNIWNQSFQLELPSCSDGIQNGDETAIDCGGSCDPCIEICDNNIDDDSDGLVDCNDDDCISDAACPSCFDGIQNGDELGLDCGGSCEECLPDLVVQNQMISNTVLNSGDDFVASFDITNIGSVTSPGNSILTRFAVYLSDDEIFDSGSDIRLSYQSIPPLMTGESALFTIEEATSDAISDGVYHMLFVVDDILQIEEQLPLGEENNIAEIMVYIGVSSMCCNGIQDNGETGIDCGGPCGIECPQTNTWDTHYVDLFTESTFNQDLNTAYEVGTIPGSAQISSSGAATYSIPIYTAPGTKNMVPSVSLNYSSQARDGLLGYGWNLSATSMITRANKTLYYDGRRAPIKLDNTDVFAIDGSRLIVSNEVDYNSNTAIYKTEMENFTQILPQGGLSTPAWFQVNAKSGITSEYGKTEDSKLYASDGTTVINWGLSRTYDQYDNYIDYKYTIIDGQMVLDEILYTGNLTESQLPYNAVKFSYAARGNKNITYIAGEEIQFNQIVKSIEVFTDSESVKKYDLIYANKEECPSAFCPNIQRVRSYLQEIIETGSDNTRLNSTKFKYGVSGNGSDVLNAPITLSELQKNHVNDDIRIADFNGDGIDDVAIFRVEDIEGRFLTASVDIYTKDGPSNDHFTYRASESLDEYLTVIGKAPSFWGSTLGNIISIGGAVAATIITGGTAAPLTWTTFATSLGISAASAALSIGVNVALAEDVFGGNLVFSAADFNGDEKEEVVLYTPATGSQNGVERIFTIGLNETMTSVDNTVYNFVRPSNTDVNNLLIGDYDGDSRLDFLLMLQDDNEEVTKLYIAAAKFDHQFKEVIVDANILPSLSDLTTARINPGDYDGDGKTDVLTTGESSFVGSRIYSFDIGDIDVTLTGTPRSNSRSDLVYPTKVHYIRSGDFNGDGRTDLLTATSSCTWEVAYFDGKAFRRTGFSFGGRGPGLGFDKGGECLTLGSEQILNIADYNGDGLSDIMYIPQFNTAGCSLLPQLCETTDLANINISYSTGRGFEREFYDNPLTAVSAYDLMNIEYGDFNGDGLYDILNAGRITGTSSLELLYFNKKSDELLMTDILDGFNNRTSFEYSSLTDPVVYERNLTNENPGGLFGEPLYPVNYVTVPFQVVQKMTVPNGNFTGLSETTYKYYNATVHREGKGFLGFLKTETRNTTMDAYTVAENELFPNPVLTPLSQKYFFLRAKRNEQYVLSSNTLVSGNVASYVLEERPGDGRYWHKTVSNTSTDYLQNRKNRTSIFYDDDGNVYNQTTVAIGENQSGIGTQFIEKVVKTSDQFNDNGSWIPNKPELVTTTIERQGESPYTISMHYDYNSEGSLIEKIDYFGLPQQLTTTYSGYNSFGHPTQTSISGSGVTSRTGSTSYDNKGRFIIQSTNTLGQMSSATYDPKWGKSLSTTSVDGLTSMMTYDGFGREVTATSPTLIKSRVKYVWDVRGGGGNSISSVDDAVYYIETDDHETMTNPALPKSQTWFDGYGRERQSIVEDFKEGAGHYNTTALMSYDVKGWKYQETNPHRVGESALLTTHTYDDYNRLVLSQTPVGDATIAYAPTAQGELSVTATAPDGKIHTTTTDAAGKELKTIDSGGNEVVYSYFSHGQPRSVTVDGIEVSTMTYDEYARQTSLTDKNAGATTYDYNPFGELVEQIDARGLITTSEYDQLGRITTLTSPEGVTTYNYVSSGNGRNQLESITYNNTQESYITSESYIYDNFNRANSKTEVIHGETFVNTMTYDNYNRVTQEVYPSGLVIRNEYDDISSLTQVTNEDGTIEIFRATASNAYGQLTQYDLGNGTSSIMDYNIYGLPTRFRSTGAGVFDMSFTMDERNGNLISRSDAIVGQTEMFTYDSHDRLKSMEVVARPLDKVTLNYEPNGNIQNKSDVSLQDYIYDANKIHAVTNIQSPMPIAALDQMISYNSAQQPTDISEGVADEQYNLHYEYGPDQNRRHARLTQGADPLLADEVYERYFVGSYERDIQDGVTRDIHYLGMGVIVVQEDGGSLDYYYSYADYQGSILAVTDYTGGVVARQSFDAWGRKRNAQDWTDQGVLDYELPWLYRGYTGHEMLQEFDLINMNGRLYDPIIGRMLSPDNYAGHDGTSQGYNRYSYVNNNPLKYIDPSGETWELALQNFVVTASRVTQTAAINPGVISGLFHMINAALNPTFNGGFLPGPTVTAQAPDNLWKVNGKYVPIQQLNPLALEMPELADAIYSGVGGEAAAKSLFSHTVRQGMADGGMTFVSVLSVLNPWSFSVGAVGGTFRLSLPQVLGRAQSTGTRGHAFISRLIGLRYTFDPRVSRVTYDLGYKKLLGQGTFKYGPRPDVGVLFKSGRVKIFEVASKSDNLFQLASRNSNFMMQNGINGSVHINKGARYFNKLWPLK